MSASKKALHIVAFMNYIILVGIMKNNAKTELSPFLTLLRRVDLPPCVISPFSEPDMRFFRIRLFAKLIIQQLLAFTTQCWIIRAIVVNDHFFDFTQDLFDQALTKFNEQESCTV